MPMMVIVKPGTKDYPAGNTTPMAQPKAMSYLKNIIGEGSRVTNLSQALTQAFDGRGKATSDYTFHNEPVLHASHGVPGVSSVSLFFYEDDDILYLFAMGHHKSSTVYQISDFGPNGGAFKLGSKLAL
jgi:hypothetical protein